MSDDGKTTIRVGHSPDSDDAFMFYALTHDKLDTGGLRFVHQLEDIETLNQRALQGELEVSAVSIHAFAHLADRYALLGSGSSMGDRYGPTLVTREPMTLDDLRGRTIAIPGKLTTAYLTLQLCLGKDVPVVVMPFDEILPAVAEGRVEAGLLIHEGQLYYGDEGCTRSSTWASGGTSRPGSRCRWAGNVVRKDLGEAMVTRIARLLKESIRLRARAPRRRPWTTPCGTPATSTRRWRTGSSGCTSTTGRSITGRKGARRSARLLARAAEAGLVPGPVDVQFVG